MQFTYCRLYILSADFIGIYTKKYHQKLGWNILFNIF